MAVTKRTRFEVLRRDNHTCQYCGAKAPDVTLHIDHVMPVALGGDDKPGNLVTACKDCNSGKTSIMPDSPLVEGLSDRAAAYALGVQDRMTRFRAGINALEDYVFLFHEVWDRWVFNGTEEAMPLPKDYKMSLYNWMNMGIPSDIFELIIPVAHEKYNQFTGLKADSVFRYMAGVLTNMLDRREIDLTLTEETTAVYTEIELDEIRVDSYWEGRRVGRDDVNNHLFGEGRLPHQDFLEAHIFKMTSPFIDKFKEGGSPPWRETEHLFA